MPLYTQTKLTHKYKYYKNGGKSMHTYTTQLLNYQIARVVLQVTSYCVSVFLGPKIVLYVTHPPFARITYIE